MMLEGWRRLTPFRITLLVMSFVAIGFSAAAYTGPYRWLAELQFWWSGHYQPELTFILLAVGVYVAARVVLDPVEPLISRLKLPRFSQSGPARAPRPPVSPVLGRSDLPLFSGLSGALFCSQGWRPSSRPLRVPSAFPRSCIHGRSRRRARTWIWPQSKPVNRHRRTGCGLTERRSVETLWCMATSILPVALENSTCRSYLPRRRRRSNAAARHTQGFSSAAPGMQRPDSSFRPPMNFRAFSFGPTRPVQFARRGRKRA